MGVLHAVRQCAAALMCTRCVGTPACYDWRRWVMNWVILMVVQYCYDLHTRYLYRKTLQRGAADVPARTGTDAIRASKLGGGSRGGAAGNSDKSCGTTDEACLVTSGGLGETQAQGTHAPTNAESWPGPPSQESTNAATPRRRDADINADIIALRSVAQVHGLEGLEAVHRNTVSRAPCLSLACCSAHPNSSHGFHTCDAPYLSCQLGIQRAQCSCLAHANSGSHARPRASDCFHTLLHAGARQASWTEP